VPGVSDSKCLITAGWGDVPHIPPDTQKQLLDETPPHLRDARTKGVPSMGAGAIYPVEEEVYLCDPFQIPKYWPRVYALDVGWNRTACIWGALDRDTSDLYLYAEHYRGQAEPSIHSAAIKARGDWIPGVVDPAARGRSQHDGQKLIATYRENGLTLHPAKNSVEAGIYAVWERLSTGHLKVFRTLQNWRDEQRYYRRDEKGAIVKERDHLMDATRYLVMSGLNFAIVQPVKATTVGLDIGDPRMGY
jgi:hypothetical protein